MGRLKLLSAMLFILAYSFGIAQDNLQLNWAFNQKQTDLSTSYMAQGKDIAFDSQGNVYAVGYMQGAIDFDPSDQEQILTANGKSDIYIAKYDADGNYVWAINIGAGANDIANAIQIDKNGNLYIVGTFTEDVDFDPSANEAIVSSEGGVDIFVAKYSADGDYIWAKGIGSSSHDHASGIAIDKDNNIYFTGDYKGTADFDPSSATANLTANDGKDIFIAKFDSDGNYIWAESAGSPLEDAASNVVVDSDGNAYVTGYFESTATFDHDGNDPALVSNGNVDIFIAKYNTNGEYQWAKGFGAENWDQGEDLTIDENNTIYISGRYQKTVDFDPSDQTAEFTAKGTSDIFVAKYDANGNYINAFSVGASSYDCGQAITLDNANNICITGYFSDRVDFDPSDKSSSLDSGDRFDSDIFIAKYKNTGEFLWAEQLGGDMSQNAISIKVDNNNSIYITGYTKGEIDFDPTSGEYLQSAEGTNYDIIIAKLTECTAYGVDTQTGFNTFTWIDGNEYTEDNNTATHVIKGGAISGCDSIVTLDLTLEFKTVGIDEHSACETFTWIDGNTYTESNSNATHTLVSGAKDGSDSIVQLHLTIIEPSTYTDVQTACAEYRWQDGNTYTESNNSATYIIEGGAKSGCDSIITLDLTIYEATTGTDVQTACETFTWIDGQTYTESNNTATHTLTNKMGCDSIVTLDLTIYETLTGTDIQTACGEYTWIDGETYTESNNTATHTLTSKMGCDSIVTLDLTIYEATTGTDIQTACGEYTWVDGETYTESNNTATHTLTSKMGCDSIVTLNLTIYEATTGTDVQTACESFTWIDGETYTESNNTATHTLTSKMGCDSIVTLDLTIYEATTGTDIQTACGEYTWVDGETYTESNNTATHTLTNKMGCDSIVTLNLTINQPTYFTDWHSIPGPFTWIDGKTYTEDNNTATYTLTNAKGCDSIITLDLTILETTYATDVHYSCDFFTWIDGQTYTESNNTATHIIKNSMGGDSIITLDLTIYEKTAGVDVQTACGEFTWINGQTYTESTTETTRLTNSNGCDSIVRLELTITPIAIAGDNDCSGSIESGEVAGDINRNGTIDDDEIAGDIDGNGLIENGEIAGDINADGEIGSGETLGDINGDKAIGNGEIEGDANGNGILDEAEITAIDQANILCNIFPNPAKDIIHINLPLVYSGTVKLIDNAGKTVKQKQVQATKKVSFTISDLPTGMYKVQISDAEIESATFIKQ